ncbi:uncharacterized protein LOC116123865 [Pistacia vera]|uniref:uncharacterized protein LOC116123865 n=1 Tax=Pistacia vera TaxID=55513 RepID=UPI001262CD93|nr:uncharacterized protein LOC116123865 [Pistacia vera]
MEDAPKKKFMAMKKATLHKKSPTKKPTATESQSQGEEPAHITPIPSPIPSEAQSISEDSMHTTSDSNPSSPEGSSFSVSHNASDKVPITSLRTQKKPPTKATPSRTPAPVEKGKKKAKSVMSASSSGKISSFISFEAKNRFKDHIVKRTIVCEANVEIDYFPEFSKMIKKRKWIKSVTKLDVSLQTLVQEFYANFGIDNAKPDFDGHDNKVYVRGKWVHFSVDVIRDVPSLPVVENPFKLSELKLDDVAKVLIGGSVAKWPKNGFLQPSVLTPLYRLLFTISLTNWSPSMHNSMVRADRAQLFYRIGVGKKIDLGTLIYTNIRVVVETTHAIQV